MQDRDRAVEHAESGRHARRDGTSPSSGPTSFAPGFSRAQADDAVRRLADLTRGRESIRQLPDFASRLLGTTSAHVAFLSDVQEVQAGVGLASTAIGLHTPPEESMCSVTVAAGEVTAIEDADQDPRVAALPPVASGAVRSYLGVPLEVRGLVVGALCVFDDRPRRWSEEDAELLRGLAAPIMAELELAAIALDHQSERVLWQLAVDAAGVGAFDWYLGADELRWDERLLEIFGLDAATFGGTIAAFNEAVHPEDRDRVTAALQGAIDRCGVYAAEYRIVRPDGAVRWISARGRALAGPDGTASRVLGAAYDTTAAVEGEASVRRVLEAMPSAFFHLDRSWRFSYLNGEAARLLGGIGSEIEGANIWELFPAAVGTEFERHYRGSVESGRPAHFEAYYPPPLDTWYDVRAWPTPDGLSVYFVDATDRRRAQELAELSRDRAELLAAVTDALSGTLQPQAAAAQLARLVVGPLAQWSIVSLIDHPVGTVRAGTGSGGHGEWRRGLHDTAGWHADPEARDLLQRYLRVRVASLTDDSFLARAIEQDEPVLVATDAADAVAQVLHPGEAHDLLTELDPGSLAVLPLRARGRTLGVLSVFRPATVAAFTQADLEVLGEIAARAGLALDNGRLYADQRDLAEQLQRSLLTAPPPSPGMEVAVRYVPAAEAAQVGGDWYDAFDCGDGSTVVVIGDVVGHDTAAAAAMGQLRGLLRGIAVSIDGGPAEVLSKVDGAMQTLRLETTATAIVARMSLTPAPEESGAPRAEPASEVEMTWANAGHPPPLVLLADGTPYDPVRLDDAQVLLGFDPAAPRTESTVRLPAGSTVFLYTDGLVERRGEVIDEGIDALRGLLSRLVGQGVALEALCDRVLAELLPTAPEDDTAVIAVRVGTPGR